MDNRDFFDGLSETITRTARDLGGRLNNGIETQKIRSRIYNEERVIEKLKADIGSLIYSKYDAGELYDGELGRLCLQISDHYAVIRRLENENARHRGKKICAYCKHEIGLDSLFCPNCGKPCQEEEPEKDESKIIPFDTEDEDQAFEGDASQEAEEAAQECECEDEPEECGCEEELCEDEPEECGCEEESEESSETVNPDLTQEILKEADAGGLKAEDETSKE